MMKRRRLLVAGAVALAGGGVAAFLSPQIRNRLRPPVLVIPPDHEIVEVRACLLDSTNGTFQVEAIPEFVVPPDHIPDILRWLKPAEYIREPWTLKWLAELGNITICNRDGKELRLRFYDAGHNPAILTVDGVDQFYGRMEMVDFGGEPRGIFGGVTLASAVRRAHEARFKSQGRT